MITDKQYRELQLKFEELSQKYAQMSQDIASIKMKLDMKISVSALNKQQSKRDITKYFFDNRQLSKRQLVLACIKKYIADTQMTSARKLLEIFPDCVQGSLGVIRSAGSAEQYLDAINHYYFNDEDVLNLDEGPYVVCKDWTASNIGHFIDIMESLGYEIKILTRN